MEGATTLVLSGQAIGVAVHTDGDGPELRYARLARSRGSMRILATGTATDAQDLRRQCGHRAPLAITFHTPRCLHRVIQHGGTVEDQLREAFPGAATQSLIVSCWREGQGNGLSVVRNEQVTPVLNALRAAGFRIVAEHVGPWGLLNLRAAIGDVEDTFALAGEHFAWNSGTLTQRTTTPQQEAEDVIIGDERIPATHALAVAAAWEQLLPTPQRLDAPGSAVVHDRREERDRLLYERGIVAFLLVMLIMLGVDAWARHSADGNDPRSVERTQLRQDVTDLENLLTERRALAEQLGIGRAGSHAERAMHVLRDVPVAIRLDRVWVDPLRNPLRAHEEVNVQTHHIQVRGTCTDGRVLNSWINSLRTTNGIRAVRLVSFTAAAHDEHAMFEIDIEA